MYLKASRRRRNPKRETLVYLVTEYTIEDIVYLYALSFKSTTLSRRLMKRIRLKLLISKTQRDFLVKIRWK